MRRRTFLKQLGMASSGALMFHIVPATVLGTRSPSNRINIGMVGTGRQAVAVNFPGFARLPDCQVVAINDVDAWRMDQAAQTFRQTYAKQDRPAQAGLHTHHTKNKHNCKIYSQ